MTNYYQRQAILLQVRRAQQRQQERLQREAQAERRARRLLRKHLTPKQLRQLKKGYFEVKGSRSGHIYRINCHRTAQNIVNRTLRRRFCILIDNLYDWSFSHGYVDCPKSDHLLAQKLIIETNEGRFLRIAERMWL